RKGSLPNLIYMSLPCDHTEGTKPGWPTPRAMVADNDLALGRIVEAITKSRFWKETCILVVEDDPQNGFDHIDGHRTVALVISPYTRRKFVDSTCYNQTGMVKTIELILGLPPMNQLDLSATAMRGCFQNEPDLTPYVAVPNKIPLDEMNRPMKALRTSLVLGSEIPRTQFGRCRRRRRRHLQSRPLVFGPGRGTVPGGIRRLKRRAAVRIVRTMPQHLRDCMHADLRHWL